VTLTGFLREEDYQSLLLSADVIIVITDQEYTLTCGAYEAVALSKPMILSDTTAIKEYFSQGAVYAKPTSESLLNAMELASKSVSSLAVQTKALKENLEVNWSSSFLKLNTLIDQIVCVK
jgi:glycosyltransferase involved in cell wall biosynthesis